MENLLKEIKNAKAVEAAKVSIRESMKAAGVESLNPCLLDYQHVLEAAIEQWKEMGLEFTCVSYQTQVDFTFPKQGRIEVGRLDDSKKVGFIVCKKGRYISIPSNNDPEAVKGNKWNAELAFQILAL